MPDAAGRLCCFLGRAGRRLQYFGPLQKCRRNCSENICYSQVPNEPRVYVQDRIRNEAQQIAQLLGDSKTHVYIAG